MPKIIKDIQEWYYPLSINGIRNSGTLVTEYAGLSPTRLRILNGLSRAVGHMYTFDISTSTCIKIVISYMLPCYNS